MSYDRATGILLHVIQVDNIRHTRIETEHVPLAKD